MADDVYKVGRTHQDHGLSLKRLKMYPGDSHIICIYKTIEKAEIKIEREILDIFKNEFGKHPRGSEYFQGDEDRMIEIIHRSISIPPKTRFEKHPLKRFIDTDRIILDQSKFCPLNLFMVRFNEWCTINQLGRMKFNEDFYKDVFSLFNLRIDTDSLEYNGTIYGCQLFIFGLYINDTS